MSSMFVGTRDKCLGCKNTVYPTEKVNKLQTHKEGSHGVLFMNDDNMFVVIII